MKFFIRAVVTGFGLTLGAAIYKRVAKRFGFDEKDDKTTNTTLANDGATDPGLHHRPN